MDPATSLPLLRPNNPPFSEPLGTLSLSCSLTGDLSLARSLSSVWKSEQKQAQKQL